MSLVDNRYAQQIVRSAAILTTGYVPGVVIGADFQPTNQTQLQRLDVTMYNFLALEVNFTLGSLTDVLIKIEFSEDNTNWYQLSNFTTSTTHLIATVADIKLSASFMGYLNINGLFFNGSKFKTRYIRISAEGEGTVTSSSLAINAVLGTL